MESESCIWLSPEDRARLEGWVAGRKTPQKLVWRARIVLMWSQRAGITEIIRATDKTKRTAYRWRDRYLSRGVAGLERNATRPGRKPPLDAATIERVVNLTLNEKPPTAPIGRRARSPSGRPQPFERAAHLGSARAQTASDPHLQTVQRSQVLREGSGHCRALPRSAQRGRWCSRSTRRAKSRRLTAP